MFKADQLLIFKKIAHDKALYEMKKKFKELQSVELTVIEMKARIKQLHYLEARHLAELLNKELSSGIPW